MKNIPVIGKMYHITTNRGVFMYRDYTQARNKSWEILIKSGITQLPVNLKAVAKYLNVSIIPYSRLGNNVFSDKMAAGDGFTTALLDGKKTCLYKRHKRHEKNALYFGTRTRSRCFES